MTNIGFALHFIEVMYFNDAGAKWVKSTSASFGAAIRVRSAPLQQKDAVWPQDFQPLFPSSTPHAKELSGVQRGG